MNDEWIRFHLTQAAELLALLQASPDSRGSEIDLAGFLAEAIGHLNACWNGRMGQVDVADLGGMSDDAFRRLREAPSDLRPI